MPNTVFSPLAFESTADGLDSGSQVFERNVTVRGTLAAARLQVPGATTLDNLAVTNDLSAAGNLNLAANGESSRMGSLTELVTIAAAATTTTATFLLPANSVIRAVVGRVTVAIPTAATFTVGDATTAARFASAIAVAINTTFVGLTHVGTAGVAGPRQPSAAQIVITPNLTPGTNVGRLRLTVFFETFVAPTA